MERFQRHGPQTVRILTQPVKPRSLIQKVNIREWLPELRSVDTEFLLSGNISERDTLGYPAAIVETTAAPV